MTQLTLKWHESDGDRTQILDARSSPERGGVFRIGRDPATCDVVLSESSVSRQHVEVFFKPEWERFYLRNLQRKNPPRIDGGTLIEGEVALSAGSTIELGQMTLTIAAIEDSIESSVEFTPQILPQTVLIPPASATPPQKPPASPMAYGLECPHCHQIASIDRRNGACHHCGHFLADAESVLLPPSIR